MGLQYQIFKEDYETAKQLGLEMQNNPCIVQDAKRLSGLLADVLCGNKLAINVLGILLNEGILRELSGLQESNDSLYYKYVMILEQRYGISNAIAQRMVWIWLYSYRSLVLGKVVPYQIVSNGSSMPLSGSLNQQTHDERLPANGGKDNVLRQNLKKLFVGRRQQETEEQNINQGKKENDAYHSLISETTNNSLGGFSSRSDDVNHSSQTKQMLCFSASRLIATTLYYSFGVKSDGSVLSTKPIRPIGEADYGQGNVSSWKDIVSIAASDYFTIGLTKKGTVLTAGYLGYGTGEINVSAWRDIISVAVGANHVVGLKRDGTVAATGGRNSYCELLVDEWHDIVAVAAGSSHTVGLKRDGTVLTTRTEDDLSEWSNIIAIAAGGYQTVGLKKDGSIISTQFGRTEKMINRTYTGIAVNNKDVGYYGITNDGKAIECSEFTGGSEIPSFNNIIAIVPSHGLILGLKSDGTIVSTKYNGASSLYYGQDRVSGWQLF